MRVYEIVLRSGAKTEITAEILHDDKTLDNKIYFYRDSEQKQLVAYFLRDEIAGIILGADSARTLPKPIGSRNGPSR
jgi:hypothetical protein